MSKNVGSYEVSSVCVVVPAGERATWEHLGARRAKSTQGLGITGTGSTGNGQDAGRREAGKVRRGRGGWDQMVTQQQEGGVGCAEI